MDKKVSFRDIITEVRVKSWLKNVLVCFPIVFSLELVNLKKVLSTIVLVAAFCLVSSAVYIFNDLNDIEADRKHETKKYRPIASGRIIIPVAVIMMVCFIIVGVALSLSVNFKAMLIVLAYIVINILYSKWLKHTELVDCFCIASGFVLRVMAGGTIVSEGVSNWLFLTVVSMSLFMAFGKRKGEIESRHGNETRNVLKHYDKTFLNGIVFMCAGLTMVFYSLWTISHETKLVYTVPIVLFIVIRYLMLVFRGKSEGDPTNVILSDRLLLIAAGICAVVIIIILYEKILVSNLPILSHMFCVSK